MFREGFPGVRQMAEGRRREAGIFHFSFDIFHWYFSDLVSWCFVCFVDRLLGGEMRTIHEITGDLEMV